MDELFINYQTASTFFQAWNTYFINANLRTGIFWTSFFFYSMVMQRNNNVKSHLHGNIEQFISQIIIVLSLDDFLKILNIKETDQICTVKYFVFCFLNAKWSCFWDSEGRKLISVFKHFNGSGQMYRLLNSWGFYPSVTVLVLLSSVKFFSWVSQSE